MNSKMKKYYFFTIIITLFLIVFAGCSGETKTSSKDVTLVVNSSGGIVNDGLREAFLKPYTEETGIKIQDTSPVDLGKLKSMVESGNVEWDITEISGQDIILVEELGLLEPIDYSVINKDNLLPGAVREHSIGVMYYSTILGFRTDAFSGDEAPQAVTDLWDVEKFPGKRSLRNHPVDNLEFALLADGVPPEELYPLDVDRAFKKLDEIKPHVSVWWDTGAQPTQLLIDNEVVMSTAWNSRVSDLIKQGESVDMVWQDGVIKDTHFGIPKGAKNIDQAQELLSNFVDPEKQAIFAGIASYSGSNTQSFENIADEEFEYLPTSPENLDKQIPLDVEWWAENNEEVVERWNEWILK